MKNLIVFSGAGVSAESGLNTFRDNNGLWENHRVEDVATPQAWKKDPEKVLRFYNQRRKQLLSAKPNAAHLAIANLEKKFDVTVITQNVDDLHEQAGSTKVVHLHGELKKAQSCLNPNLIYELEGDELNIGDRCERGSQLRPHVVWFGEAVPMMEEAFKITTTAEIFIVIGTSLNVYPAALLVKSLPKDSENYIIDPNIPLIDEGLNFTKYQTTAGLGMEKLSKKLLDT